MTACYSHVNVFIAIDRTAVHADSDEATRELVHDHEHPVAPEHDGLASKEVHAPQAVFRLSDERQPRGPVATRGGVIVFRQHAVHDVLVDVDPERVRDQVPRNVASIVDSARELGIRDAQVYGLVSQSVAQRMREIGIRLALGAGTNDVIGTLTQRVIVAAVIGLVGGSAAAPAMARTLQALLYGVRATDAVSFVYAGMAMLIVTAIAAFVPALHATRIDPAQVLRGD
jgi:hypothetical protein